MIESVLIKWHQTFFRVLLPTIIIASSSSSLLLLIVAADVINIDDNIMAISLCKLNPPNNHHFRLTQLKYSVHTKSTRQ